jgi:hypothetical protein
VRPEQLSTGAGGFLLLGETRALRQHLENWLDQKIEPSDAMYVLLTYYAHYQWTHDRHWLSENQTRVEEMLTTLSELDVNGDGLPEYHDPEGATEPYDPFITAGAQHSRKMVQWLQTSAAAVAALRQGAMLLQSLGGENRLTAAKFRAMAEVGEQTIQSAYWNPHWRTPQGTWRSMPSDDPDYKGDGVPGQGAVSLRRTHEVFRAGLEDPQTAAEALEKLLKYARGRVLDPKNLSGLSSNPTQDVVADFNALNLVELYFRSLAGLDFSLDGLRIHIPAYPQDLEVRVRHLTYHGAAIEVEVKGAGPRGRIYVNGQEWDSRHPIPNDFFAQGKVQIRIQREP